MAIFSVKVRGTAKFEITVPVEAGTEAEASERLMDDGIAVADIAFTPGALVEIEGWGIVDMKRPSKVPNPSEKENAGQQRLPYDKLISMSPEYVNRKLVELQKRIEVLESQEAW
jgi:hypothetical protein